MIHRDALLADLSITFQTEKLPSGVAPVVEAVLRRDAGSLRARVSDKAVEGLKFSVCLPPAMAVGLLAERTTDEQALQAVFGASLRVVDAMHRERVTQCRRQRNKSSGVR